MNDELAKDSQNSSNNDNAQPIKVDSITVNTPRSKLNAKPSDANTKNSGDASINGAKNGNKSTPFLEIDAGKKNKGGCCCTIL